VSRRARGFGPWATITKELQRRYMRRLLRRFRGNGAKAAAYIGLNYGHLGQVLSNLNLSCREIRRQFPKQQQDEQPTPPARRAAQAKPRRQWFGMLVSR
jgi:hypothetical protein